MGGTEYEAQGPEEVKPQAQEEEVAEPASADKVERARLDLQFLDAFWEVIQTGDCFCRRINLRLYSDGLADFSAFTSTTSSGDVWLFKGIALLGANGDELFRIGQFNGPRMDLTAHDYFVVRTRQTNPLVFPQQLFPIIHGVTMYSHC